MRFQSKTKVAFNGQSICIILQAPNCKHLGVCNAALEVGSSVSNPGNLICVCVHVSLLQSCQAGSLMWTAEKPQTMGSD